LQNEREIISVNERVRERMRKKENGRVGKNEIEFKNETRI
jgi:hypothetical protein